jgi:hypothetical protein
MQETGETLPLDIPNSAHLGEYFSQLRQIFRKFAQQMRNISFVFFFLLFGLTGPPRLIPTVWQRGKQVHHNMLYMYCVYINIYLDLINAQGMLLQ